VIYSNFTKYSAKINKNKKDKIVFKTAHNHIRDVICMVSKIEGCILPDFKVQDEKETFLKVEPRRLLR